MLIKSTTQSAIRALSAIVSIGVLAVMLPLILGTMIIMTLASAIALTTMPYRKRTTNHTVHNTDQVPVSSGGVQKPPIEGSFRVLD